MLKEFSNFQAFRASLDHSISGLEMTRIFSDYGLFLLWDYLTNLEMETYKEIPPEPSLLMRRYTQYHERSLLARYAVPNIKKLQKQIRIVAEAPEEDVYIVDNLYSC